MILRKILRKIISWSMTDLQNVIFDKTVMFAPYSQVSNSKIGKRSSIGRYSKVTHTDIGMYCSISWDVTINAVSHDYTLISTHSFLKRPDLGGFVEEDNRHYDKVTIGNDVWIGAHSVILPGVKIGDGAIIGAGSIVTRDVESYSIVAGNSAKFLRWRFDKQIISELKEIKRWLWEDSKIKHNINFFTTPLTMKSIQELKANNCTDHL